MSAFPSLPLFTDAFIADTGHLSAQETGAYLMLLMVAWRSPDCRLPDSDDKLARWARVDRRTWLRIKPAVMEFWTLAEGFWTQKRLSKERSEVSKRAEVARQNGKQGGRPKSLENKDADNPAGSPRVSQTKAPNPSPNPKIEEEGSDPDGSGSAGEPSETDHRSDLFTGRGLKSLMRMTGKSAPSCKPLIGKWLKIVGDSAVVVLVAIDAAEEAQVANPIAWIEAYLKREAPNHVSGTQHANGVNGHRYDQGPARQSGGDAVAAGVVRWARRSGVGLGSGHREGRTASADHPDLYGSDRGTEDEYHRPYRVA